MTVPSVPAAAPVLEITGLTVDLPKGADRIHAVENVSLRVGANETVCVVGESGSGKSVTAHATVGLLPRTLPVSAGTITFEGRDLTHLRQSELREIRGRDIGMIFQEPMTALNPIRRVGEQIAEVFKEHSSMRQAKRRDRSRDLLREVNLEPDRIYDAYPHQLSGGQLQRVMIAIALAFTPRLLIADEPTTALDVTTQAQILRLIKDLQARHDIAVMFITHDFGVVAEIADQIVVMRHGEVVEHGPATRVLDQPAHAYTRMLIAAVPTGQPPPPRPGNPVPSAPLLKVTNLEKTYVRRRLMRREKLTAVDNVSFEMAVGDILGVVGESGSGKSTVARCIARLVDPDGGEVEVDAQPMSRLQGRGLRRARRNCQTVFQNPHASLNPRLRVGTTIAQGLTNFGMRRGDAWQKARSLLSMVQMDPAAVDRYPHEFSGGQRQRICLARALALEPRLLIADEAVSALDVSVQAQIIELFRTIRQELGIGILFITHDLRVAAQLCDHVVVMKSGKIVESGPIGRVFTHPQHAYTRALLNAIPGRSWFADAAPPPNTTVAQQDTIP